jgi:hypothetical protein
MSLKIVQRTMFGASFGFLFLSLVLLVLAQTDPTTSSWGCDGCPPTTGPQPSPSTEPSPTTATGTTTGGTGTGGTGGTNGGTTGTPTTGGTNGYQPFNEKGVARCLVELLIVLLAEPRIKRLRLSPRSISALLNIWRVVRNLFLIQLSFVMRREYTS